MKISVKRTGGIAGLSDSITLDTESMDSALVAKLEQEIRALDLFNLPSVIPGGVGSDYIHYEITAQDKDRRNTIAFDFLDDAESPRAAPLRRFADQLLRASQ